jgi:hypothetical protein
MRRSGEIVAFKLNKREKIIISSFLITFAFLFITQGANIVFKRYYLVLIITVLAFILPLWSLKTGISKTKFLTLFILPVFYCTLLTGFYFLFSEIRWLTRLPIAIFLGLSTYSLILTQNVFNVSSDRNIPLYRAASAVNFIFTIFTAFLLFIAIFSLDMPFYLNGVVVFLFNLPLILQILWTVKVENITSQMFAYSAIASLIVGECAVALSFWSAPPAVKALLLDAINYVILGIIIEFLNDRISKRTVLEYSGVGVGVFFFIIMFTYLFN